MTGFLVVLLAAAAALAVARATRLPSVPLLVLAGVAAHAIGVAPPGELLRDALLLGLAFLVFVAGTELNPTRAGAQKKAAVVVGLVQFFAMGALGTTAGLVLGLGLAPAIYLGIAITASSTLVVVNILRQRKQFFEPYGRLVLGVLLLQDILIIIAIGGLASVDDGAIGVARGLGATIALIALAAVLARWVAPWIIGRLNLDEEGLLLAALATLFAFIALSHWLGLPLVVGALLAGVSLSGFPVQGLVRGQVSSLGDFFLAVFFVTLGALLELPTLRELVTAALLILLVLTVTPPLVAWTARRVGLSSRVAVESGLFLAQGSEFSLVVALLGWSQGQISDSVFNIVAIVTVVTMILTPFVATDRNAWLLMRFRIGPRATPELAERPRGHVLILGCGRFGRVLADRLEARGERTVVIDDDRAVVERLRGSGAEVLRGDGADYAVLRAAGAREAKAIVSNMRRIEDHERMLRFVWEARVPVFAPLFSPDDAERLAVLGAEPVIESDVAAEQVLAWFDERFPPTGDAPAPSRPDRPSAAPA